MNRRTFVKMAASSTMLGAIPPVAASPAHEKTRTWPETALLDNPIANGLFPLKFSEELPLALRAHAWTNSFEKETELFRFTAHEWITDAVLFRGMEIKPRKPSNQVNQELRDVKLSLFINDSRVSDGFRVGDFMMEGGRAFRRWDRDDATKILYCSMVGWDGKDDWRDRELVFLGYFLPNKDCISIKMENSYKGNIELEIKCDMARYSSKK